MHVHGHQPSFNTICPSFSTPCSFCPSIASPAFSTPANLSVIFLSCIFQPCTFVRHFPVLHFPVLQFQSPPYDTWFFLKSFISCHCCERNFEYLNWLSTRICGAGRPHVGLCPAHLVVSGIHSNIHLKRAKLYFKFGRQVNWLSARV